MVLRKVVDRDLALRIMFIATKAGRHEGARRIKNFFGSLMSCGLTGKECVLCVICSDHLVGYSFNIFSFLKDRSTRSTITICRPGFRPCTGMKLPGFFTAITSWPCKV